MCLPRRLHRSGVEERADLLVQERQWARPAKPLREGDGDLHSPAGLEDRFTPLLPVGAVGDRGASGARLLRAGEVEQNKPRRRGRGPQEAGEVGVRELGAGLRERGEDRQSVVAEAQPIAQVELDRAAPEPAPTGSADASAAKVGDVEAWVDAFGAKDEPVVLFCRAGGRAGRVKKLLESEGWTQVYNAGGLSDLQ